MGLTQSQSLEAAMVEARLDRTGTEETTAAEVFLVLFPGSSLILRVVTLALALGPRTALSEEMMWITLMEARSRLEKGVTSLLAV